MAGYPRPASERGGPIVIVVKTNNLIVLERTMAQTTGVRSPPADSGRMSRGRLEMSNVMQLFHRV